VKDKEQIFLAVVSDTQWKIFCQTFGLHGLLADERLASNNQRVSQREWMMPILRAHMTQWSAAEIARDFEKAGLPYAPINAPHQLFDDPHLKATGGLAPMKLPDGREVATPLLPIMLDGQRLPLRNSPPELGVDTDGLLKELGYTDADVQGLREAKVVA
jgi:crotonobetainyl-CoA:carnitine CoA-transferase CaiB-like acyl-CoA transferase